MLGKDKALVQAKQDDENFYLTEEYLNDRLSKIEFFLRETNIIEILY